MPYSSKRTDNTCAMAKSKKDKKKNTVSRNATQVLWKGKQFFSALVAPYIYYGFM